MQELPTQHKSFWRRPEGIAGLLFLVALIAGAGLVITTFWTSILAAMANTLVLAATLVGLGILVYMVADPKTRALVSYMYKSAMRAVTGLFVQIDPVGILKSYVEEMSNNLQKLREQIGKIRGQMRQLSTLIATNEKEIENQLSLAKLAQQQNKQQPMILSSRKAARLQESNQKYAALLSKLNILYRILTKMHDNSEILVEDTKDQVQLKEQERKAIRASHSAMKSAMSVINGSPDQRAMFDMAMEAITEDVANKVGEMERFMEMSSSFMSSIDLQNGVFEEQGLKMLEEYERKSELLLGDGKLKTGTLDLNSRPATTRQAETVVKGAASRKNGQSNGYDQFF